jgi:hypothetical protein
MAFRAALLLSDATVPHMLCCSCPVVLSALRRRLTAAVHDFQGAAAQYEDVIRHGLDLEAVVKCRQLGVYEPPGLDTSATGTRATLQRLMWRYRCSVEVSGACSYVGAGAVCIHCVGQLLVELKVEAPAPYDLARICLSKPHAASH